MKPSVLRYSVVAAAALLLASASRPALAQSFEEQARVILALYESGKTDSAYTLIEPLKASARFVPAVIYTRAKMTPDDRALGLLKELIALEPGGDYADDAAFELVSRYVAKGDSLAAATWLGVLRENYPLSSHVNDAESLVKKAWGKQSAAGGAKKAAANPARKNATARGTVEDDPFRGYALQVGLFPSRESALARADELRRSGGIRAIALPKVVGGEKQYALVVGPYASIDAANDRKAAVASVCDCQAFIVKVE